VSLCIRVSHFKKKVLQYLSYVPLRTLSYPVLLFVGIYDQSLPSSCTFFFVSASLVSCLCVRLFYNLVIACITPYLSYFVLSIYLCNYCIKGQCHITTCPVFPLFNFTVINLLIIPGVISSVSYPDLLINGLHIYLDRKYGCVVVHQCCCCGFIRLHVSLHIACRT